MIYIDNSHFLFKQMRYAISDSFKQLYDNVNIVGQIFFNIPSFCGKPNHQIIFSCKLYKCKVLPKHWMLAFMLELYALSMIMKFRPTINAYGWQSSSLGWIRTIRSMIFSCYCKPCLQRWEVNDC